jgi:outer membrane protein assembly factor BamB
VEEETTTGFPATHHPLSLEILMSAITLRRWAAVLVLLTISFVLVTVCTEWSAARPGEAKPPTVFVPPVQPGTWPMLGGTPGRNQVNPLPQTIPATWEVSKGKEGNLKWSIPLGTYSYGGPVIAGGRIFIGTNNANPRDPKVTGDKGIVMCFDEATGKFLWQAVHDKLPNPNLNDTKEHGVASNPVIDGDRLYYVSNRCEVVCATTAGKGDKADILWTYDLIKELKVYPCYLANSSPLVIDDLVFALTANGTNPDTGALPSPEAPTLVAINKKTGKLAWSDASPGKGIMYGQWSSPAAYQVDGVWQVVYGGGDGWLRGFDAASGKALWKFDLNPKNAVFKRGGSGDRSFVVGVPVVAEGRIYVAVGWDPDASGAGHLWCIDPTRKPGNKDLDLTPPDQSFDPKSPANKDSGLVWHLGGPILPRPKKGRDIYFGRTLSTVAVHDGLVYAAEMEGFLKCLDARTGEVIWDEDLKSGTWNSPFYVDGKVFMGTDNEMIVFKAGRQKQRLATIDMEHPLKTPPVAVNGVLYVNTSEMLFAISQGGK